MKAASIIQRVLNVIGDLARHSRRITQSTLLRCNWGDDIAGAGRQQMFCYPCFGWRVGASLLPFNWATTPVSACGAARFQKSPGRFNEYSPRSVYFL